MLFVYLMDNKNKEIDEKLNFTGFFIVLLAQETAPWDLKYTIIPISFFIFIMIGKFIRRRRIPNYNPKMKKIAFPIFCFAILCFLKGTDEFNDYLRFFHGMWHLFVGIGGFYAWQLNTKNGEEISLRFFFEN